MTPKISKEEILPNGSKDTRTRRRQAVVPQSSYNMPIRKASTKVASAPAMNAYGSRIKRPTDEKRDGLPKKVQKLSHEVPAESKKAKAGAPKPKTKATKPKVVLNAIPSKRLNIYMFGTNEGGEVGFGAKDLATEYRRPRLNRALASVGIVQIAVGGLHCAALTQDNAILTWGVHWDETPPGMAGMWIWRSQEIQIKTEQQVIATIQRAPSIRERPLLQRSIALRSPMVRYSFR